MWNEVKRYTVWKGKGIKLTINVFKVMKEQNYTKVILDLGSHHR